MTIFGGRGLIKGNKTVCVAVHRHKIRTVSNFIQNTCREGAHGLWNYQVHTNYISEVTALGFLI